MELLKLNEFLDLISYWQIVIKMWKLAGDDADNDNTDENDDDD